MTDNLQDLRIPDSAFDSNDVKHLEDVPSMSAADLKAVFDYGAEKIVTPALNALIAFLASSKAAGALGITGIDGVSGTSIQGLLDGMKDLIDDRYTKEQSDRLFDMKLNQSTANGMVKDVKIDLGTGVIRVAKLDGSFEETDTALEKIAVNVEFDAATEELVLTLPDGDTQRVNISDFVKLNEFIDSDVIQWSVSGAGGVIATIKPESITTNLLAPALLADFVDKMQKAAESAANAKASEKNAETCLEQVRNYMSNTLEYRDEAKQSAYEAAVAKNNAKISETNAKTSETNAAASAAAAAESARKAVEIVGGDFATKTELSAHTRDAVKHITAAERTAWNAKQDKLTFDTAPTSGSKNPVTSGGIKTAIDNAKKNKADLVGGKVPAAQLPAMDYAAKDLSNISGVYKSVLDKLEVANRYTWIKSYKELGEIKETALTEDLYLTRASGTGDSYSQTITVVNNLAIESGTITYTTGDTIGITYNTDADTIKSTIAGKYIIGCNDDKTAIYKISSNATINQGLDSNGHYCRYISASLSKLVTYSVTREAYTEKLTSTNRNAYADSVETDDYTLVYSGVALDDVLAGLKIASGSYVGTGASGSSNPNSLSFNFAPVLVMVWASAGDLKGFLFMSPNSSQEITWWGNISSSSALGTPVNTSFRNGGKTVSWYNPSDSAPECGQLNRAKLTYSYFAIGI